MMNAKFGPIVDKVKKIEIVPVPEEGLWLLRINDHDVEHYELLQDAILDIPAQVREEFWQPVQK